MNGLNKKWNTEKSTTEEINRNFKNMWIRGQELWNCPVRGEQRKKNGSVSDVLNNLKRKQPSKYWRLKRRREEEGDKNRMYNCNVTTCFTGEKHSNHNFYMSGSWVKCWLLEFRLTTSKCLCILEAKPKGK